MRAVKFDRYGNTDVLHVAEVDPPVPGEHEVLVRVRAAGTNPGEVAIRSGAMDAMSPAHFPEGQGTDLAGVVDATGGETVGVRTGDGVIGWSDTRGAQAEFAVLPMANTLPKPADMAWDQAAVIPVVGGTAVSVMQALRPKAGETLVVGGASGGVGFVVAQLARRAGVTVVGSAAPRNHDGLRAVGIEPVSYGEGVADRLRAAAPHGIDAFADCAGHGNVELALDLGVPAERINTIIDFETAGEVGAQAQGMYQLDDIRGAVASIVELAAAGEIQIPIRARFPLEQVQDAYADLARPAGIGKIVFEVSPDD